MKPCRMKEHLAPLFQSERRSFWVWYADRNNAEHECILLVYMELMASVMYCFWQSFFSASRDSFPGRQSLVQGVGMAGDSAFGWWSKSTTLNLQFDIRNCAENSDWDCAWIFLDSSCMAKINRNTRKVGLWISGAWRPWIWALPNFLPNPRHTHQSHLCSDDQQEVFSLAMLAWHQMTWSSGLILEVSQPVSSWILNSCLSPV